MATRFLQGLLALTFVVFGFVSTAQAQNQVWVQIEAHPNLATAEQRVRAYSQLVDNVNGFRATTGLYAVSLGPFDPETGQLVLQRLLGQGLIPRDSYLEDGGLYATQFFPVAAGALDEPTDATDADTDADAEAAEEVAEPVETAPLDETPQQARQSEALLTREQRDELQIALQWFGFYNGRIDGAFGPGTRGSMQAYQESRGMEPSGILTTRQRAQLLDEYQSELAALGMRNVLDQRAGVQIDLPMAMVEFDSYNFPFAQYEEINDSGVRVMLISQPGDRATLFGLYEIMQTLEIVPLEGERERGADSFTLTGQSSELRSHTEARLVGGAVKGFTLIWEPSADEQVARVLPMMQESFRAVDGTLDPAAVPEGLDESVDMVSGLTVRRPDVVRTGFYIDARGTVLTTTEVAGQCGQILIDNAYEASVAYRDDTLGIVVLSPNQQLAPLGFAQLASDPARLRSEIAVAGYPFGGALSSASTTFGSLEDLRGMNGEETMQRLAVETADTEAGGPVLDLSGNVIGMVLPGTIGNRALPSDVTMALRADQLIGVLADAGVSVTQAQPVGALNRENLSREAADMTVRVSCWN
ncbi:serine protease [Gymnodinialimonas ceratoperidinii]|uniref:Trypsin-like peptidase domain-containing protein n=1 Tax=Gymnodinialimonas ceratoperidinii TaxID=2856823 RepID=A0A8F6TZ28_9RHOB|nr:serine protease [Gymnodinialimonas ceratoperidinii]QXT41285.1 trypsin-like peptidase domain-containing protein [Gymnodinialimonas ceratoperidinii]